MTDSHPSFPNPTAHEVVCEIHFSIPEGIEWRPSTYGDYYNRIREDFPTPEPAIAPNMKMLYTHKSGSWALQLSETRLIINVLEEYPGWDQLQKNIITAWNWLREIVGPLEVNRIGLRYINLIPRSSPEEKIREWLQGNDYVASALLQSRQGFSRLELSDVENRRQIVTVANATVFFRVSQEQAERIVLDIDCIAEQLQTELYEFEEILKELHNNAWEVFDSFRTPKLNAYLQKDLQHVLPNQDESTSLSLRYSPTQAQQTPVTYEAATPYIDIKTQVETLEARLSHLFSQAEGLIFEDGRENAFSKELLSLIEQYGDIAVNKLILMFEEGVIPESVAAETLHWLGHMGNGTAYQRRLWLLEHSLTHHSPWIREGAALGLALLEDPHAIPFLQEAIAQEEFTSLRGDLLQVLSDLQELSPQESPRHLARI